MSAVRIRHRLPSALLRVVALAIDRRLRLDGLGEIKKSMIVGILAAGGAAPITVRDRSSARFSLRGPNTTLSAS